MSSAVGTVMRNALTFLMMFAVFTLGLVAAMELPLAQGEPGPVAAPPSVPPVPPSDGFDWPVGPPDAQGYYDAQSFGVNQHKGEDWNGVGGGNSDLGDPVHSIAAGRVTVAEDFALGWGKVVRVVHQSPEGQVESLYAHLDSVDVEVGQVVARGQKLGGIGDADGVYVAHLHFELRRIPGLALGGGYGTDRLDHLSPSEFIARHRP